MIAPDEADRREGEALECEEAEARRTTSLTLRDNGDGTWSGAFRIPELHATMLRKALHALSAPRRRHLDTPGADSCTSMSTPERLGTAFTQLLERFPADRLPKPAV